MLHLNIGDDKLRCSWGLEFAYWNFSHFPWSVDMAVEFEKQKIRLYSEAQTGLGLAGLALGPVMEIQTNEKAVKLGLQTSVWGNYYWGFDLRGRFIGGKKFFCPGTYLKAGFAAYDENGNMVHSSSHTYHHFHDHHH
jgi:hypothetical protein